MTTKLLQNLVTKIDAATDMKNLSKKLYLLFAMIFLPSYSMGSGVYELKYIISNECPQGSSSARDVLIEFSRFTDVEWKNLSISEATIARLLVDELDLEICSILNNTFKPIIDEVWSDGSNSYDVNYFEFGGNYYVARSLSQPDDGSVAAGLTFIYVFNSDLEYIHGVMW